MIPRLSFFVRPVLSLAILSSLAALSTATVRADEHLFGWVRGAETLPKGHFDAYQFLTLRSSKTGGIYRGWDSDTELEYGITDQLQIGAAIENHAFKIRGVEDLDNKNTFQFGGAEVSAKYRVLSPFKDRVGLAVIFESGYFPNDDVAGIRQHEVNINPQLALQKNFLDDTLIFQGNLGVKLAWGKRPAEEYAYELALQGGMGVSYRFAPNWFIGLESHIRSEFPEFDLSNHEHTVVFAGPSIHYGAQKWWATASYGYQIYGTGVDEPTIGKTFAEESRHEFRIKVGLNF